MVIESSSIMEDDYYAAVEVPGLTRKLQTMCRHDETKFPLSVKSGLHNAAGHICAASSRCAFFQPLFEKSASKARG